AEFDVSVVTARGYDHALAGADVDRLARGLVVFVDFLRRDAEDAAGSGTLSVDLRHAVQQDDLGALGARRFFQRADEAGAEAGVADPVGAAGHDAFGNDRPGLDGTEPAQAIIAGAALAAGGAEFDAVAREEVERLDGAVGEGADQFTIVPARERI